MHKDMPSDSVVSPKTLGSQALVLATAAAVVGPLMYVAVTLLHPPGMPGNDHPAVFREYAMAQTWTAVHLAQLAGLVVGLVGIAGLAASLVRLEENGRLFALLAVGLVAASIPIALVLQAVDGIALKRAVDAWVVEGGTVESASFAAARAIRWLEEGLSAVFGVTLGSAAILVGVAMLRGTVYPRWIGWIGAALGIGVLINGILVAETGFSPAAQIWVFMRNPGLWIWTAVAGALMWRRLPLLDAAVRTTSPGSGEVPGRAAQRRGGTNRPARG